MNWIELNEKHKVITSLKNWSKFLKSFQFIEQLTTSHHVRSNSDVLLKRTRTMYENIKDVNGQKNFLYNSTKNKDVNSMQRIPVMTIMTSFDSIPIKWLIIFHTKIYCSIIFLMKTHLSMWKTKINCPIYVCLYVYSQYYVNQQKPIDVNCWFGITVRAQVVLCGTTIIIQILFTFFFIHTHLRSAYLEKKIIGKNCWNEKPTTSNSWKK